MARINVQVTMKGIYSYEAQSYAGYGMDTHYIYNMVSDDGTVYVWKTTTFMCIHVYDGIDPKRANFTDAKGRAYEPQKINKGDVIEISATVKGQGEYKGQPQTIVNRVKVLNRIFKAKSWEEVQEEKRIAKEQKKKSQKESLQGDDFIWRMPYKQYKEHYADCETVIDSFDRTNGVSTIEVIVREGRLKTSGVRGQCFHSYEFTNENGEKICYVAVSENNATKRVEKEYPEHTWVCNKIYW